MGLLREINELMSGTDTGPGTLNMLISVRCYTVSFLGSY